MITATGIPAPKEAEVWALHQAILWVQQLSIRNVTFEMDCKSVVDHFMNSSKGFSISRCRVSFSNLSNSR
ncbi:hypothetical protein GmHk_18G051692 [Glycine max]|nr:hypothetical protein GmHk_18G051692 [Glycine max]